MYGLISTILAVPGRRDALGEVLLAAMRDLPGCLSYVVARDTNDDDALWVTEVWRSREAHRASLERPAVRDAIARGSGWRRVRRREPPAQPSASASSSSTYPSTTAKARSIGSAVVMSTPAPRRASTGGTELPARRNPR